MNRLLFILLLLIQPCFANVVQDDLVNFTLKNSEKPEIHTNYDYQYTEKIPVKMSITKDIKSESDVYEGQDVCFNVVKNVYYNKQLIIPENTKVSAKVETIITSGMNGIPASIIFGSFKISDIDSNKIDYTYEKFGQDRSLFVFPLKWALTFLPPTGSLTNFIKGGHAKLKTNRVITIYYHPNWI